MLAVVKREESSSSVGFMGGGNVGGGGRILGVMSGIGMVGGIVLASGLDFGDGSLNGVRGCLLDDGLSQWHGGVDQMLKVRGRSPLVEGRKRGEGEVDANAIVAFRGQSGESIEKRVRPVVRGTSGS